MSPFRDTLYLISQPLGGFSAKERGQIEEERMVQTAAESPFLTDSFFVDYGAVVNIGYRDQILTSISGDDTVGTDLTVRQIATQRYPIIVAAVSQNAKEKNLQNILINIGSILIALVIVVLLMRLVRWLFKKLILRL